MYYGLVALLVQTEARTDGKHESFAFEIGSSFKLQGHVITFLGIQNQSDMDVVQNTNNIEQLLLFHPREELPSRLRDRNPGDRERFDDQLQMKISSRIIAQDRKYYSPLYP
jgi:hypothetical protein